MNRLVAALSVAASAIAGTALPTRFEEVIPGKKYVGRASGYAIEVTPERTSFLTPSARIEMEYQGARTPRLTGEEQLPGRANYFTGADRAAWRSGIKMFGRIRHRELYPGIDAVLYASGGLLEYDLIVHTGADASTIRLRTRGAEKVSIDGSGDLVVSSGSGDLRWKKPEIYQLVEGRRVPVQGSFLREDGDTIRFKIGAYDRRRDLIIDPVLVYSSYLGGTGNESGRAIAVDGSGNVYVAGVTTTQTLPVRGGVQAAYGGHNAALVAGDAFVAKFNSNGALSFLTYLGGSGDDFATSAAVDAAGNVWIAGGTSSNNFPVSANAFQKTNAGTGGSQLYRLGDGFFARISANGDQLMYSSFFGGKFDDLVTAIALDATGNVYLTGGTTSLDLPLASAYQSTMAGSGGEQVYPRYGVVPFNAGDVFLAKFNPAGTELTYSTYFGGNRDDMSTTIAVDGSGAAYIGGYTLSAPPSFPVSASAYQRVSRGGDLANNIFWNFGEAFVAKFGPSGAMVYSTLLGGSGDDVISSIAVDSGGNVYATGFTCSKDFPVTAGVVQAAYRGPGGAPVADQLIGDVFVSKLDPAGSRLVFSTYLGGSGDDAAMSIRLDPDGNIVIAGMTDSQDFPVSTDATQGRNAGGGQLNQNQNFGDAFLAQLDPQATKVQFGTYLGGSFDDVAAAMTIDRSGNAYLTGITASRNFPLRGEALQSSYGGTTGNGRYRGDAFFAKFSGLRAGGGSAPALTALQNAASYGAGTVSPGMVFVVYGNSIGPANLAGVGLDSNGKLSTAASDTQLLFDGVPAPLVYVSAGQSSGIVPYEVNGKTATQVVAVYQGLRSVPLTVSVATTAPGLFSADFSGTGQGAIYNQDGVVNSSARPARRGDIVVLYGTGEGETDPQGINGLIAAVTFPKPRLPVSVSIGGQPASEVLYAGAVPGVVAGVFQINVRVPENIGAGTQPVVVRIGANQSQANLRVALQ